MFVVVSSAAGKQQSLRNQGARFLTRLQRFWVCDLVGAIQLGHSRAPRLPTPTPLTPTVGPGGCWGLVPTWIASEVAAYPSPP